MFDLSPDYKPKCHRFSAALRFRFRWILPRPPKGNTKSHDILAFQQVSLSQKIRFILGYY